jgi:hypothetical protein
MNSTERQQAVLTFKDLRERKGWPYTPDYTQRLIKDGRFPRPFQVEGSRLNLWLESEIDAFLAERARTGR